MRILKNEIHIIDFFKENFNNLKIEIVENKYRPDFKYTILLNNEYPFEFIAIPDFRLIHIKDHNYSDSKLEYEIAKIHGMDKFEARRLMTLKPLTLEEDIHSFSHTPIYHTPITGTLGTVLFEVVERFKKENIPLKVPNSVDYIRNL